jgi:hypothetical protein
MSPQTRGPAGTWQTRICHTARAVSSVLPNERPAAQEAQPALCVDCPQADDVATAGTKRAGWDPALRVDRARAVQRQMPAARHRQHAVLVVTLDHGDPAGPVVADAEAREDTRAASPQRDEAERRCPVAGCGRRGGCRRRGGHGRRRRRHRGRRVRGDGRAAVRGVCRYERPQPVPDVRASDAVSLTARA